LHGDWCGRLATGWRIKNTAEDGDHWFGHLDVAFRNIVIFWAMGDAGGIQDGGRGCRCGRLVDHISMPVLEGAGPSLCVAPEAMGVLPVIAATAGGVTSAMEAAAVMPDVSRAEEYILVWLDLVLEQTMGEEERERAEREKRGYRWWRTEKASG